MGGDNKNTEKKAASQNLVRVGDVSGRPRVLGDVSSKREVNDYIWHLRQCYYTWPAIVRSVREEFGISIDTNSALRRYKDYVIELREEVSDDVKDTRMAAQLLMHEELQDVYGERALKEGDYEAAKVALKSMSQEAQLLGLNKDSNVDRITQINAVLVSGDREEYIKSLVMGRQAGVVVDDGYDEGDAP